MQFDKKIFLLVESARALSKQLRHSSDADRGGGAGRPRRDRGRCGGRGSRRRVRGTVRPGAAARASCVKKSWISGVPGYPDTPGSIRARLVRWAGGQRVRSGVGTDSDGGRCSLSLSERWRCAEGTRKRGQKRALQTPKRRAQRDDRGGGPN